MTIQRTKIVDIWTRSERERGRKVLMGSDTVRVNQPWPLSARSPIHQPPRLLCNEMNRSTRVEKKIELSKDCRIRFERSKILFCSARTTIGANTANVTTANSSSIHALPVAFGYLKIIEKQQPKYVDKLTPHITKLLQKLIKDHTSAGLEYNPGKASSLRVDCWLTCDVSLAYTEYIVECLTLLKYRIGQLSSDLRKQFMNNFLPVGHGRVCHRPTESIILVFNREIAWHHPCPSDHSSCLRLVEMARRCSISSIIEREISVTSQTLAMHRQKRSVSSSTAGRNRE